MVHATIPTPSSSVTTAPGYDPVILAADLVLVVVEIAECGSVVIDNVTYAEGSSFMTVSVQVQAPAEHYHGGGSDYYLLGLASDDPRIVGEASRLGLNASRGVGSVVVDDGFVQAAFNRTQGVTRISAAGIPENATNREGRIVYHWVHDGIHEERHWHYSYDTTDVWPAWRESREAIPGESAAGLAWLRYGAWRLAEEAAS